jgi:hypothetical protein
VFSSLYRLELKHDIFRWIFWNTLLGIGYALLLPSVYLREVLLFGKAISNLIHLAQEILLVCSAHLWAEATPGVSIAAKMTDFDFKRDKRFPWQVQDDNGKTDRVEMDGLLSIKRDHSLGKDKQYLLELETGSHEPAAIRRKVYNLVRFSLQFEKAFGTKFFSGYLFFATASYGLKTGNPRYENPEEHRKIILREIAQTLRDIDSTEFAPVFRVTAAPIDSTELFTRAVWYTPGDYSAYHLFSDIA